MTNLVYGLCLKSDPTIRYIGVTSREIHNRLSQHALAARNGKELPVYRWWRKHDDVTYVILHSVSTIDEMFDLERREIASRTNLLNCTTGGEGLINPSAETRAKMSKTRTGRKLSAQHRANLSLGKIGNKNTLGYKHREESKAKMSAARKGKKQSPEQIAKRAATHRGKTRPKIACPHCDTIMDAANARRYHFDKCKMLNES